MRFLFLGNQPPREQGPWAGVRGRTFFGNAQVRVQAKPAPRFEKVLLRLEFGSVLRLNQQQMGSLPTKTSQAGGLREPRVKGVAFRTIEQCFLELWGAEAHQQATRLLAVAVADAYRYGTLLSASWYPISWYREVFRAFRAATGAGPELPRRIGALAVRHDMKGAHKRLVAWLASPQMLLGLSQRVFNTYYDTGRVEILESRAGYVRMAARGCTGWDLNMWSELAGSSQSLLEAAGAQRVRVRPLSGGQDGDANHELEAHWTAR